MFPSVASVTKVGAGRCPRLAHVLDVLPADGHATGSTASQVVAAMAVGVIPAKAMTS